jgi:CHAT domain-containing protein
MGTTGKAFDNEPKTRNITPPNNRLVVLSAGERGLGQFHRGKGIVSLYRPLLAGVPTVVARLWSVDSQETSDLIIAFHSQRTLANSRARDALRNAQLKLGQTDQFGHRFCFGFAYSNRC